MEKERDATLDFIKVLATSLIVCHHFQQTMGVRFTYINFFGGRFYFGYLVELFFIISGICAARWIQDILVNNKPFTEFMLKRASRLLPLTSVSVVVFSCMAIIYALIKHEWLLGRELDIFGIATACLGIQCGWATANPMINNPIWYISVLQLCYVVMYFATWIANRLSVTPYFLYVGIIFAGMGIQTYGIDLPFFNCEASRGYTAFFLGIVLSKFFERVNVQLAWKQMVAWLCFVGIILLIVAGYEKI